MSLSQVGMGIMQASMTTAREVGQNQVQAAEVRSQALAGLPARYENAATMPARIGAARELKSELDTKRQFREKLTQAPIDDAQISAMLTGVPASVLSTVKSMNPKNMYEFMTMLQGLLPWYQAQTDMLKVLRPLNAADKAKQLGDNTTPGTYVVDGKVEGDAVAAQADNVIGQGAGNLVRQRLTSFGPGDFRQGWNFEPVVVGENASAVPRATPGYGQRYGKTQ